MSSVRGRHEAADAVTERLLAIAVVAGLADHGRKGWHGEHRVSYWGARQGRGPINRPAR